METLLFLQVDQELVARFHRSMTLAPDTSLVEVTDTAQLLRCLQQPDTQVQGLVLGPRLEDPLRLTQRVHAVDREIPVLILCTPEDCHVLSRALQFTALLGKSVICRSTADGEALVEVLQEAITRREKRRSYHGAIAAANARLAAAPPLPPLAQQYLDRLLDYAPIGVVAVDVQGTVMDWNQQAGQILGKGQREAVGSSLLWLFPENERGRLLRCITRGAAATQSSPGEIFARHWGDGTGQFVEVTVAALTARTGEAGALVLLQDVTERVVSEGERQRAEEALRRAKDQAEHRRLVAESLADVGHQLVRSLDPEEVAQRIVDRSRDLFGALSATLFRLEAISGDLIAIAISGAGGPRLARGMISPRDCGVAGYAVRVCAPVTTPNLFTDPRFTFTPEMHASLAGSTHRAALAVPLQVQDRAIGVLAIGAQEGRVFNAEEIQLAQAFAAQAAMALENARLYADSQRRHTHLQAVLDLNKRIGLTGQPDDLLTAIAEAAVHLLQAPAAIFRLRQEDGLVLGGQWGEAVQVTLKPRLKIGESLSGVVAATGEPLIVNDLRTESRMVPEHLAWSLQYALLTYMGVPLRVGERVIGVLSLYGRTDRRFTPADVELALAFADQAAIALENQRLYGELQAALQSLEASQQRVVQTERLRALGEMAGGVAHDFNNTLAVILGHAQLLLRQIDHPEVQQRLQVIERATRDGARTVRRIQEFSRLRPARPFQEVSLSQIVAEVLELTGSRWQHDAQVQGIVYALRVEMPPLPPVLGDPAELREALTNLVLNALDAMPAGGQLTVRTSVAGAQVCCQLTDTGVGMPVEVQQRIFDPFFTTKGDKGSGLGLSMAYGIITRHGGEIRVHSRVGQGSTFSVWLPVATPGAVVSKPAPPAPTRRQGKILVIDDDADVRDILLEVLSSQGHEVKACADGSSGLRCLEAEPFDLVITDLGMPGLSGWEVAAWVKAERGGTPVVVITGWGDSITPAEARAKGVDFLLPKPFDVQEVARIVSQALLGG